jgi:hypothetical protein
MFKAIVYIVAAVLWRDNVLYEIAIFQCMGHSLAYVLIVYTAMFVTPLCPGG